jgi:hypothetical protein
MQGESNGVSPSTRTIFSSNEDHNRHGLERCENVHQRDTDNVRWDSKHVHLKDIDSEDDVDNVLLDIEFSNRDDQVFTPKGPVTPCDESAEKYKTSMPKIFSTASRTKVEAIPFVSSGRFHPLSAKAVFEKRRQIQSRKANDPRETNKAYRKSNKHDKVSSRGPQVSSDPFDLKLKSPRETNARKPDPRGYLQKEPVISRNCPESSYRVIAVGQHVARNLNDRMKVCNQVYAKMRCPDFDANGICKRFGAHPCRFGHQWSDPPIEARHSTAKWWIEALRPMVPPVDWSLLQA